MASPVFPGIFVQWSDFVAQFNGVMLEPLLAYERRDPNVMPQSFGFADEMRGFQEQCENLYNYRSGNSGTATVSSCS